METNRNNKTKEFVIGTNIEYNGKLYEVVEQKFCDECSIKNICPNNDVAKNNSYNLLSRDERVKIFGECSPDKRKDDKSVVFKEVSMTKSDNINHNIIQPLVEANGTIKDLQIKAPVNFEIDVEASCLDKGIIAFKRKWLTIEEMYELKPIVACEYVSPSIAVNVSTRKKIVAISNLMDIANYFNGDWKFDFTKECVGYSIAYYKFVEELHYSVIEIDNSVYTYYGNPIFKNEADAQYVIDNPNFRDILDTIFKG